MKNLIILLLSVNLLNVSIAEERKVKKHVRWSGFVINTTVKKEITCFTVVDPATYKAVKLKQKSKTQSKFIACSKGKFSNKDFKNKLVTIKGVYLNNLKNKHNSYPVIQATSIVESKASLSTIKDDTPYDAPISSTVGHGIYN